MNYYPFHIGDYLSATRHLTWVEDAAYRRLLDTYYTTEKPLPLDAHAVYRLVLATSKSQRTAVDVVLAEFFERTDAGWISGRADAEIDAMRVKQSAQEEKDQHESDRMRRYRERRAALFDALRAVGVVPAWDVPMKELQRLADTHCNASPKQPATPPETHLQREQVVSGDGPATAISTNTNTNTSKEEKTRKRATPFPVPDWINKVHWDTWHSCKKRRGATDEQKQAAVDKLDAWRREGIDHAAALESAAIGGWQGLFKPDVRNANGPAAPAETVYQRSMRERMEQAVPSIARRAPSAPHQDAADFFRTVETTARVVPEKQAIEVNP